jgi:hypothetical protein
MGEDGYLKKSADMEKELAFQALQSKAAQVIGN